MATRRCGVAIGPLVTTLAANTQASTAAPSVASSLRAGSVENLANDKGDGRSRSVAPSNASRIVEPTNGSDDEEGDAAGNAATPARAQSVIDIDEESSVEGPAAEESDKAERGMIQRHESIGNVLMSTQIASQKTGTHRYMRSSTLSHLLTMLETPLDVFMSSSATRRLVRAEE
jgi:hypothetical protein